MTTEEKIVEIAYHLKFKKYRTGTTSTFYCEKFEPTLLPDEGLGFPVYIDTNGRIGIHTDGNKKVLVVEPPVIVAKPLQKSYSRPVVSIDNVILSEDSVYIYKDGLANGKLQTVTVYDATLKKKNVLKSERDRALEFYTNLIYCAQFGTNKPAGEPSLRQLVTVSTKSIADLIEIEDAPLTKNLVLARAIVVSTEQESLITEFLGLAERARNSYQEKKKKKTTPVAAPAPARTPTTGVSRPAEYPVPTTTATTTVTEPPPQSVSLYFPWARVPGYPLGSYDFAVGGTPYVIKPPKNLSPVANKLSAEKREKSIDSMLSSLQMSDIEKIDVPDNDVAWNALYRLRQEDPTQFWTLVSGFKLAVPKSVTAAVPGFGFEPIAPLMPPVGIPPIAPTPVTPVGITESRYIKPTPLSSKGPLVMPKFEVDPDTAAKWPVPERLPERVEEAEMVPPPPFPEPRYVKPVPLSLKTPLVMPTFKVDPETAEKWPVPAKPLEKIKGELAEFEEGLPKTGIVFPPSPFAYLLENVRGIGDLENLADPAIDNMEKTAKDFYVKFSNKPWKRDLAYLTVGEAFEIGSKSELSPKEKQLLLEYDKFTKFAAGAMAVLELKALKISDKNIILFLETPTKNWLREATGERVDKLLESFPACTMYHLMCGLTHREVTKEEPKSSGTESEDV